jgi:hypothetical protein
MRLQIPSSAIRDARQKPTTQNTPVSETSPTSGYPWTDVTVADADMPTRLMQIDESALRRRRLGKQAQQFTPLRPRQPPLNNQNHLQAAIKLNAYFTPFGIGWPF